MRCRELLSCDSWMLSEHHRRAVEVKMIPLQMVYRALWVAEMSCPIAAYDAKLRIATNDVVCRASMPAFKIFALYCQRGMARK